MLELSHQMIESTTNSDAEQAVDNAKFQRAQNALVRLILKHRMATYARAKELGEDPAVAEEPVDERPFPSVPGG